MQLTSTSLACHVPHPAPCSLFTEILNADTCFEEKAYTQMNNHRPLESVEYYPIILPNFPGKFALALSLSPLWNTLSFAFLILTWSLFHISLKTMKEILWDVHYLLITYFIYPPYLVLYTLSSLLFQWKNISCSDQWPALHLGPGHNLFSLTKRLCSWE